MYTFIPKRYAFIIFALIILILILRGYYKNYELSFNGTIQKIRFEELKYIPYITVNGKEYDLWYSYHANFNDTLAVGDSAIKIKGEKQFELIKK